MFQVISTRLSENTASRLDRLARDLGKTPSETGAMLIEEALRIAEFTYIDFRDSCDGRQAYLKNSSLAVAEVIQIAQLYQMDEEKVIAHFQRPKEWVRAAFNYFEAYPTEIEAAIAQGKANNEITLKQLLPQLEVVSLSNLTPSVDEE